MEGKKLVKSNNAMISGVAAGVAEYFGIDTTIVRIIWAASIFFAGFGFWVYIICLFIMPKNQ